MPLPAIVICRSRQVGSLGQSSGNRQFAVQTGHDNLWQTTRCGNFGQTGLCLLRRVAQGAVKPRHGLGRDQHRGWCHLEVQRKTNPLPVYHIAQNPPRQARIGGLASNKLGQSVLSVKDQDVFLIFNIEKLWCDLITFGFCAQQHEQFRIGQPFKELQTFRVIIGGRVHRGMGKVKICHAHCLIGAPPLGKHGLNAVP